MTNEELIRGLEEAAALIAQGWTQHAFHRRIERRKKVQDLYCAYGACRKAFQTHETPLPAILAIRESIGGQRISEWNDHHLTTQEHVLTVFARTIKRLKSLEAPKT